MSCEIMDDGSYRSRTQIELEPKPTDLIRDTIQEMYDAQVSLRIEKEQQAFTRVADAQQEERLSLDVLGRDLSLREERLGSWEQELTSRATGLSRTEDLQLERDQRLERMSAGLSNKEQEFASLEADLSRTGAIQEEREKELQNMSVGLAGKEQEVNRLGLDLDRRVGELAGEQRRMEEEARKASEELRERTERAREEAERARQRTEDERRELEQLRGNLRRREEEARKRGAELQRERLEIEQELAQLRRELSWRGEELRERENELAVKQGELESLAGELAEQNQVQEALARDLRDEAERLSQWGQKLDRQESEMDAEQRRLYMEAEAKLEVLEASFDAAHGEVVTRWQEEAYLGAMGSVSEARELFRAGDLAKFRVVAERATAKLEKIEEHAFDDQRGAEERKQTVVILAAALRRLGYQSIAAKTRNVNDPRSHVDLVAAAPSGKGIIFTLRHDGTTEIRQHGVQSHEEAHSVEDALSAVAGKMGLVFVGGRKTTKSKRRPAGPAIRATAGLRRKA